MVIKPRIKGFICTTTHPEGCKKVVQDQIQLIESQKPTTPGPKKVLIVGASQGFGLSSRIVSAFGYGADTLGVFFEKPADAKRPGSAGWYLTAAFEEEAKKKGLYCKSINGDAFSKKVKEKTIEKIKKDFGKVDLFIYSLASPRRIDPETGEDYRSSLNPIGDVFRSKTINTNTGEVTEVEIQPANEEQIRNTVKVMGGEDWKLWVEALSEAGVLEDNAMTVAYSYIGPEVTRAVYRNGTIGRAKEHLEQTALELNEKLKTKGGKALVSVNKALVTQASSAIPVVPLYIGVLYKVMKAKNLHEGTIEQMIRLFKERLYTSDGKIPLDEKGRVRIDNLELREDVQKEVNEIWPTLNTENINEYADFEAYHSEFLKLFGFGIDGIDYDADVDQLVGPKEVENLM